MEKRSNRKDEAAQERPARTPLGARNVLTVPERDGYHRCWVSDSPTLPVGSTLHDYISAGYMFVADDKKIKVGDSSINAANPMSTAVSRPSGRYTLYLMEVLQEYYDADRKAEQDEIRQNEVDMFQPMSDGGYGDVKGKVTNKADFPDL